MFDDGRGAAMVESFSALQRAEIAEIVEDRREHRILRGFSALQRAEIAEIVSGSSRTSVLFTVSVLFNEPKLLKSVSVQGSSSST